MTPGGFTQPTQWPQPPTPQQQWRQAGPPIRSTDRDRDAAIEVVQASYTEGRLTRAEHDTRVGQVLAAQDYAELDRLTSDLPHRPVYPDAPVPQQPRQTNGLAVASLICGVAQPFTGMLTTIPAIVLGHAARGQIRRRGDDGESLANWGLMLGWAGLTAALVLVAVIVAIVVHLAGVGPGA